MSAYTAEWLKGSVIMSGKRAGIAVNNVKLELALTFVL